MGSVAAAGSVVAAATGGSFQSRMAAAADGSMASRRRAAVSMARYVTAAGTSPAPLWAQSLRPLRSSSVQERAESGSFPRNTGAQFFVMSWRRSAYVDLAELPIDARSLVK